MLRAILPMPRRLRRPCLRDTVIDRELRHHHPHHSSGQAPKVGIAYLRASTPKQGERGASRFAQPVADISFARLDALNARLVNPAASLAGTPRTIDVRLAPRSGKLRALGYEPDPECVQTCEDQRFFCWTERCDERGSCLYCNEYYDDCVGSCPTVCVEPKSVSTYTVDQSYASTDGTTSCFYGPYQFDDLYRFYSVITYHYTYRKTVHCDDTYSDQKQRRPRS